MAETKAELPVYSPSLEEAEAFLAIVQTLVRERDRLPELHAERISHEGVEAVRVTVTFACGARWTVIAADDIED